MRFSIVLWNIECSETFNRQIFSILHSIREYLISNLECSNMNYQYLFIFSLQKLQNQIGNKIFNVVLDINRPQLYLWQLFDLLRFWDETWLALGIGSYSHQAVPWDTRGTLFSFPLKPRPIQSRPNKCQTVFNLNSQIAQDYNAWKSSDKLVVNWTTGRGHVCLWISCTHVIMFWPAAHIF